MPRRRASSGDELRTKVASTKLTPDEFDDLENRRKAAGMSRSDYIAEQLRKGQVIIEQSEVMDPVLLGELRRLANNYNQHVAAWNSANLSGRAPPVPDSLQKAANIINTLIKDELIRRRLKAFPNDNQSQSNDAGGTRSRQQLQGAVPLSQSR